MEVAVSDSNGTKILAVENSIRIGNQGESNVLNIRKPNQRFNADHKAHFRCKTRQCGGNGGNGGGGGKNNGCRRKQGTCNNDDTTPNSRNSRVIKSLFLCMHTFSTHDIDVKESKIESTYSYYCHIGKGIIVCLGRDAH